MFDKLCYTFEKGDENQVKKELDDILENYC